MDRGCFRTVPPWRTRLARQVMPRRATRNCCKYHRVDWHQVSVAAIQITPQARREGLAGQALSRRARELAQARDLPPQEKEALDKLLAGYSAIQPTRLLRRPRL